MIYRAADKMVRSYTSLILKWPVATILLLLLITLAMLKPAMTFEKNMTKDIEVYLPDNDPSVDVLLEVREFWATDTIIIYVETPNALDKNNSDPKFNVTSVNILKQIDALEREIDPFGQSKDQENYPAEIGVISDAIATPVKVIKRARILPTDTVVVFGAGGGLGIHMLMLAQWAHSKVIAVDTKLEKFEACKNAGADEVIDGNRNDLTEALIEVSNGGIDVGIDFVSSDQTLEVAANALGKGGRLVTLGGSGMPFQANPKVMLEKELELMGSRYATKQEVTEALELVARGDVWPLVTDIRPMNEAEELHDSLEKGNIIGRAAIRITT